MIPDFNLIPAHWRMAAFAVLFRFPRNNIWWGK